MSQLKSSSIKEGATAGAVRKLLMGLTAFVVLSVSAYGTVIYIQLMNKVFPTGPLLIACYLGAAASLVLMLVLLVGKFLWFRPGAHEVASWLVTLVELAVAILNMILAFQLAGDPNPAHLSSILSAWYFFAPVSPVLSMVGATILLMTSSELRSKHHAMEIEEEKEKSRLDFDLSMHRAEMDVKTKYLGFVQTHLTNELNDPARQLEMKSHASALVADVLSGISGMPSVPRLPALDAPSIVTGTLAPPASLPAPRAGERPRPPKTESDDLDNGDGWLARVNARIEQERAQRLQQATPTTEAHEDGIVTGTMIPGGTPSEHIGLQLVEEESATVRLKNKLFQAVAQSLTGEDGMEPLQQLERAFGLAPVSSSGDALSLDARVAQIASKAVQYGFDWASLERLYQGGTSGPETAQEVPSPVDNEPRAAERRSRGPLAQTFLDGLFSGEDDDPKN